MSTFKLGSMGRLSLMDEVLPLMVEDGSKSCNGVVTLAVVADPPTAGCREHLRFVNGGEDLDL